MKLFKLLLLGFIAFTSTQAIAQKPTSPYAASPSGVVNVFKQMKVCYQAGNPRICEALADNTIVNSIEILKRSPQFPAAQRLIAEWEEFLGVPSTNRTFSGVAQNHFVNIVDSCAKDEKCIVDNNTFILLQTTQFILTQLHEATAALASGINRDTATPRERKQLARLLHRSRNAQILAANIGYYFLGENP